MKKLNYKLIVSDFDGTLVCQNGEISKKNKDAIHNYVASGGKFAISTGRMPSGIIHRVEELGLKGLVACCQGSIIVDVETKTPVVQGTMVQEEAIAVCEKLEQLGVHIHVYDLWDFYSNMDDEFLHLYENAVREKAKVILDKPLSQFLKQTKMPVYKILAMVAPEENQSVFQSISDLGLKNSTVTKSAEYLVEVVHSSYSKGTALQFMANHYNVPIEKTIGIGDQWNDLPMIEKAGLGLAVQNAADALKQAATILQSTNEESAIAEAIETFGFAK